MTALEITLGALTTALLAVLLHTLGYSGVRLLSVVGVTSVYLFTVGRLGVIFKELLGLSLSDDVTEIIDTAVRIVGFGYLFGMVADMLRSLGQTELASGLEVAGRVEIFAISLPYLGEILRGAVDFMGR